MTNAKIKKALKCCYIHDTACKECPFIGTPDCGKLPKNTISLINRQQAEIEELRKTILDGDFSSYTALKAKESWYIENGEHINRLNAEIEKLTAEVEAKEYEYGDMVEQRNNVESHLETAKAEAIKEFAERLKENTREFGSANGIQREIDNLVKEMAGDAE